MMAGKTTAPKPARMAKGSSSLTVHDMPQHLRFNPWVYSGYRPIQPPLKTALTLFSVHNETLNVFTHGVPLIAMLSLLLDRASWQDVPAQYNIVWLYLLCCSFTMFGSVLYHLFMAACATPQSYESLLFFDVFGVWVLGVAVLIATVMFGFLCSSAWVKVLVIVVVAGGSFLRLVSARDAKARAIAFSSLSLARFLMNLFRIVVTPLSATLAAEAATAAVGVSEASGEAVAGAVSLSSPPVPGMYGLQPSMQESAWTLIALELAMVVAGAVNVLRFPERLFGSGGTAYRVTDYVGNSHQLMHIISAAVLYVMYFHGAVHDAEFTSSLDGLQKCADAQYSLPSSLFGGLFGGTSRA